MTGWTLTTSFQNHSVVTNLTGGITVAFTNDVSGRGEERVRQKLVEPKFHSPLFEYHGTCHMALATIAATDLVDYNSSSASPHRLDE